MIRVLLALAVVLWTPRALAAQVAAPNGAGVSAGHEHLRTTAVASDALVMKVPNPGEAAAWYGRWFGGKLVQRDGATYADIPGMNIQFEETKEPVSGTQGRALDHIGFEVENLEAFLRNLADGGVTISRPYSPAPDAVKPVIRSLAFVTDPWGTYIELNEGFSGLK